MPNTYTETGSGGMQAVGLVGLTQTNYVSPCTIQTSTAMCCVVDGIKLHRSWKFLQNAWVAAVTVCSQHL